MSENVIKEEKQDSSEVSVLYEGVKLATNIKQENELTIENDKTTPILLNQDPLSIFSLLIDIKEQLNTIQTDVNELKRKMNEIDQQTSSKLIKIDATGTAFTSKLEKVDKTFSTIQNLLDQKILGKVVKPADFPETILQNSFEELERFDDLLHDFDDSYALYYIEIVKEKLKNCHEFKRYIRSGFNLVMSRELQLQCSYTGKGGYGVNNLNCIILLQATCRTTFSVDSEIIKKYCMDYFSNLKTNVKSKQKKEIIEIRDDEPTDLMDIGDYSI